MKKLLKILVVLTGFALIAIVSLYIYFDKETRELTDAVRSTAQGRFIKLADGYVHYEMAGPEKAPLLVLIHGAGSGYYAWDNNFYALAESGFRVLRYDLYGRGLSDRPPGEYNLSFFIKQLNELTDALNINRPYSIVSVSMGAMIAIQQANEHPARVDKIVLIDPAAIDKGEVSWVLRTPVLSDLLMTIYWAPRAVEKQMKEFYQPEKVKEYALKSETQLQFKGLRKAMHSTWVHCSKNMDDELRQMGSHKKKILLLWGKNDPLTSVKSSVKYKKYIPHITYMEIDNAGHLANYEQPAVVNRMISAFLKN